MKIKELENRLNTLEEIVKQNELAQIKAARHIPYQLCPLCNGAKTISNIYGTSTLIKCDMCNGEGKILMHVNE